MSELTEPATRRQAISISRWARAAAGLLGLAGVGAGGTAVFVTDVEAGPVALIGVGSVFLLIALAGVLPSRLKIGDNEAEWQAVQEYVEATVEDVAVQDKPELLGLLGQLAQAAPQATSPALLGVVYDAAIREMIREIAHDVRPQIRTESVMGPHPHVDIVVMGPGGQAFVEIKFKPGRDSGWYDSLYERFQREKAPDAAGVKLLLVTQAEIGRRALAFAAQHDDFEIVRVTGYEDRALLRAALFLAVGPIEAG